ncbi:DNA-deoxyinosine glycosylase [Silvimonas amylolytica]|nr:DNA-deoxyinosine glycosylase [Silvimonas amylolytica]
MDLKRCFPPVVNPRTRVLILGSLPGEASLAQQQYYAHPQNRFWELLGGVIGEDLRTQTYDARLGTLLEYGVGLWDVIAEAERKGSLDAAIRNHSHNALTELIATLPALKVVAFNGGTSARLGRKQLHAIEGLQLLDLPSSSPAYTLAFAQKLESWRRLGTWLQ